MGFRVERQHVALAAIGLGFLVGRAQRNLPRIRQGPVTEHPELIRWHPELAESLAEVVAVMSVDDARRLISRVEDFRFHENRRERTSSAHMNALMNEIIALSTARRRTTQTTDALRHAMFVEQDVIPIFHTHLENVLHNHMISHTLL